VKRPHLINLLCIVSFALPVSGCGSEQPSQGAQQRQEEAITVTLGRTTVGPLQRTVEVVGTLHGDEETTISAKVPGRVTQILKDIGDRAEPDEPLAQVDRTDYDLAVTQQQLTMQEVLTKLGLDQMPDGRFDPSNVPTVQRARLQAANAEAKFKRGQQLHNQSPPLISDQDFADLETAFEVARSNHEVELLTARSLLAEAASRQSQLEQARQRLRDTVVRAPLLAQAGGAGTVSGAGRFGVAARLVSVGEYVSQGTAMFRLVADNPIKYRAAVPERFAALVKVGQEVQIRVAAYPDAFVGIIARVNPQVDMASRTFQVEAVVPNDRGLLRPGSFATGSIVTHVEDQVTFAPRGAIVSFAGVTRLFTVEDGKAVEVRIEPGVRQGEMVEIAGGLRGESDVVLTNADKLASGTPVVIGQPDPRPAPQPPSISDAAN
jgi:RND family efflux transporter MFP subunit